MIQKKIVDYKKISLLALICLISSAVSVYAQERMPDKIKYKPDLALTHRGRANVEEEISLASPRGCQDNIKENVTVLLPEVHSNFGLTINSHPTFWIYIPYEKNEENDFALKFVVLPNFTCKTNY